MLCNANSFGDAIPFGYGDGVEDDMRLSAGPGIGCGPEIGDTIKTIMVPGPSKLRGSGMQGDVLRHGVLDSVGMKPRNGGHFCTGIEDIRGFDVTKRSPSCNNGLPIWTAGSCPIGRLSGGQCGNSGAKKLNCQQNVFHTGSANDVRFKTTTAPWDRFRSSEVTAPNTTAARNSSFELRHGVAFERPASRHAKPSLAVESCYNRVPKPENIAGPRRDGLDTFFNFPFIEPVKPKRKQPRELPMRCPPPNRSSFYSATQDSMPQLQRRQQQEQHQHQHQHHHQRPTTVGDVFDSSYPYLWLE